VDIIEDKPESKKESRKIKGINNKEINKLT
jgi:hypothetical protein